MKSTACVGIEGMKSYEQWSADLSALAGPEPFLTEGVLRVLHEGGWTPQRVLEVLRDPSERAALMVSIAELIEQLDALNGKAK